MATNIKINIVEPGTPPSPTPIDPTIDPSVPNTGLFIHGIGTPEATVIVSVALVLVIVSIVLTAYMYRRHKKAGKVTKLVHIIDQTKAVIKAKKRITVGLAAIALLISAGTFMTLTKNGVNATDADNQIENEAGLTVSTSDQELTIEVGDEPVFAVLPVQVTVEEATQAGYTLTVYTDNTDLVSTTNPNNKIPMEGDELTTLEDNTWGLALDNEPEAKDNKVYTTLSTDQDNPTLITDKDYEATEANDTTIIYYGFYITPDVPYGTYTSAEVEYEATQIRTDLVTVIFDGNGLYFNGDEGQISNVMQYTTNPADNIIVRSSNIDSEGNQTGKYGEEQRPESITIPGASTIKANIRYGITANTAGIMIVEGIWDDNWDVIPENMVMFYSEEENLSGTEEYTFNGDTVTIFSEIWDLPEDGYDYGYYITVTGYDADGNVVYPTTKKLASGVYLTPISNLPYVFLGWSEDKYATEPTYTTGEEIEEGSYLAPGDTVTLYAIWQKAIELSFEGNGNDGGEAIANMIVPVGEIITLPGNTYTKEGYSFMGWNTEVDGSGQTYANEADFIASADSECAYATLYAQWELLPEDLTFTAGNHIDTLIVADSSNSYKPFYITSASINRSISFTAPVEGTKYIITVVPKPGYVLSSDSTRSSYVEDYSTGTLASKTLLTTTYTVGNAGDNITISAAQAGSDSIHPAYASMQNLAISQCPAYTSATQGINVTDTRDNKSYTVAKFGNYCYMLSNLRLDGSTNGNTVILTSDASEITSGASFTMPNQNTWTSSLQNHYCEAKMRYINGEYYYNWYAAKANPTSGITSSNSCATPARDDASLGSICPAGWKLPTYHDIGETTLWNNGTNPGMLSTTGDFVSGSQYGVGIQAFWWSNRKSSIYGDIFSANYLYFSGEYTNISFVEKYVGHSVRCMRSN